MRRTEVAIFVSIFLAGCIIPLDKDTLSHSSDASVPLIDSCVLFPSTTSEFSGGHSVDLPGGVTLWTFAGTPGSDGLLATITRNSGGCGDEISSLSIALPPTASDDSFAIPLDLVRSGDDIWQFYEAWRFDASQPFGVRTIGRGVGKFNSKSGSFDHGTLIWLADRPNYGHSAALDGGWIYAWGCLSTNSGWDRACYAARVKPENVLQTDAWQYAMGNQQFSPNPDDAQPILIHAGDLSMKRHRSGRWLATYVNPLDTQIQVRTALTPTGPFSNAFSLGTTTTEPGTFAVEATRHPQLETADNVVAVTYQLANFAGLSAEKRRPRLAILPLPKDLP